MTVNKGNSPITHDEATEALYLRAEELFLKCATITRRGLAHAFCTLHGHVQVLECRVLPADTKYTQGEQAQKLATLDAKLTPFERLSGADLHDEFNQTMREMDTLASYLDLLIARNKPMLTPKEASAA